MKLLTLPSRKGGFTLIEIMIVVAIMGVILGLAIPNFLKARLRARQQMCIENLSQIETAKQLWGIENGKREGDEPAEGDLVGASSYLKKKPICAGGGSYTFKPIGESAICNLTDEGHVL
jgi:prepilin-type N-terminal cleavage/methylation domain-containing protein